MWMGWLWYTMVESENKITNIHSLFMSVIWSPNFPAGFKLVLYFGYLPIRLDADQLSQCWTAEF